MLVEPERLLSSAPDFISPLAVTIVTVPPSGVTVLPSGVTVLLSDTGVTVASWLATGPGSPSAVTAPSVGDSVSSGSGSGGGDAGGRALSETKAVTNQGRGKPE